MVPNGAARLCRYAFMKLTRDFDSRFESLLLTGRVSKWYSEVGNEATTVPAGLALLPGDALCTLHRDLGAILAVYLDPARAFPGLRLRRARRPPPGAAPHPPSSGLPVARPRRGLLARRRAFLPLRLLRAAGGHPPRRHDQPPGRDDSGGGGLRVRAPPARRRPGGDQLHRRRRHLDRRFPRGPQHGGGVEAAARAGDREQPLRLLDAGASTVRRRGSSPIAGRATESPRRPSTATTPTRWRRRSSAPWHAPARGEGPTLVEAMLGRMRGHAEGDDSLKVVPQGRATRATSPPIRCRSTADAWKPKALLDSALRERLDRRIAELVEEAIDGALAGREPDPAVAMRRGLRAARHARRVAARGSR